MLHISKTSADNYLVDLTISTLEKGSWLNLTNPTPEEISIVAEITNTPLDLLRAALDEDERSRTEIDDDALLIIINIPVMRGINIFETLPLGIILTEEYMITVCLEENRILSDFQHETARTFATFKKTRFTFQLLHRTAILYLKYIYLIIHRIDKFETSLRKSTKNQHIYQMLDLQKGLTFFNAALRTNSIVMEKVLRLRSNKSLKKLIKFFEEDEDLLEDVIIENKQAMQMVEMYSHILGGLVETFATIVSNNLNSVMKFLASMTILLAIPTMVSSFMGMNVDVPWNSQEGGFLYTLLISFTLTTTIAAILWKKDFF